ncbi:hypothetical protein ABXW34_19500, partial [Streptococcus suis]
KTADDEYKTLSMTMADYLKLVDNKFDFDALIQDYIAEDDAASNYTYNPNQKATADTSTDQSENSDS